MIHRVCPWGLANPAATSVHGEASLELFGGEVHDQGIAFPGLMATGVDQVPFRIALRPLSGVTGMISFDPLRVPGVPGPPGRLVGFGMPFPPPTIGGVDPLGMSLTPLSSIPIARFATGIAEGFSCAEVAGSARQSAGR